MKTPDETPQIQFLEAIDIGGDSAKEYVDIYLSDYRHEILQQLPNISPRRWVKGENLKLWPGKGSGVVVIDNKRFTVTYAWGGRNKPETPDSTTGDRTSYTVRLEGEGVQKALEEIRSAIIVDELGAEKYQISFQDYERMHGIHSLKEGKAKVVNYLNEVLNHSDLKEVITKRMKTLTRKKRIASYRERWEANEPVTMTNTMKRIEPDLLKL